MSHPTPTVWGRYRWDGTKLVPEGEANAAAAPEPPAAPEPTQDAPPDDPVQAPRRRRTSTEE